MDYRITKHAVVIGTFVLLVLCLRTSLDAQSPIVLDKNPPPMAAPRASVKKSGTASAGYDKIKDLTYSASAPIALKIGDSGWGSLNATFISTGKEVTKPGRIILRLFTATKDRSHVDKPEVIVFADEKRIFEGRAEVKDARTNGLEVYASFEISISLNDFTEIVKAEKFGISLGPSGWFIPKAELSKFNDLLGIF